MVDVQSQNRTSCGVSKPIARRRGAAAPKAELVVDERGVGAPVDTGCLPRLLGFNLRRAHNRSWRHYAGRIGEGRLLPGLFSLLVLVESNPGICQVDLGTHLGVEKATMVALLDRLEQAGILTRKQCMRDRRLQGIWLTRAGMVELESLLPDVRALERDMAKKTSPRPNCSYSYNTCSACTCPDDGDSAGEKMKLATFEHQGDPAAGVIVDGSVHALCDLDATLPRTLEQVLGGGEAVIRQVRRAARNARGGQTSEVPVQMWFNKQTSCITGPYDPVQLPSVSEQLDFEGELGMVIGKRCRRVSVSDAHKVIAGYIVVNDLSVRD